MPNALFELSVNSHDQAGNYFMSRLMYDVVESGGTDHYLAAKQLIDAWQPMNENAWLKCQGSDVILDYYKAKRVSTGGGPSALKIVMNTGLAIGACTSAGVCADIIIHNSNASNRPGHIYLGGVYNNALQGSGWQPGFVTDVNALMTKLFTPLSVAGGAANLAVLYKKIKSWTQATHLLLSPKATLLNKRTLPLV
jgi:hypothetical protein